MAISMSPKRLGLRRDVRSGRRDTSLSGCLCWSVYPQSPWASVARGTWSQGPLLQPDACATAVFPPTVLSPHTVRGAGVPERTFTATALAVFSFPPCRAESLVAPGLFVKNTPLQSLERERPAWSSAHSVQLPREGHPVPAEVM